MFVPLTSSLHRGRNERASRTWTSVTSWRSSRGGLDDARDSESAVRKKELGRPRHRSLACNAWIEAGRNTRWPPVEGPRRSSNSPYLLCKSIEGRAVILGPGSWLDISASQFG